MRGRKRQRKKKKHGTRRSRRRIVLRMARVLNAMARTHEPYDTWCYLRFPRFVATDCVFVTFAKDVEDGG